MVSRSIVHPFTTAVSADGGGGFVQGQWSAEKSQAASIGGGEMKVLVNNAFEGRNGMGVGEGER